jgi:hypothetical protein
VRIALVLVLATLASAARAHPAPSSVVRLEFLPGAVRVEYWLPVSELESAYLLRHVAAETAAGARWRVEVETVRAVTYLDHPYFVAVLRLAPPPDAGGQGLVLVDDAVTHEVRNHVVYVVARRGAESVLVGALQYPTRRLDVPAR